MSETWSNLTFVAVDRFTISRRRRVSGFSYWNTTGKPIKDPATLERIRELVIPPAWEEVWICGDARGYVQAIGRDARGRRQYRYHAAFREEQDSSKFAHLIQFGEALPRIRRAVSRDLALPGMSKEKMAAAVARLLDDTCIRIGNAEYARTNESYGLTTLKNEHVNVRGGKIRFQFRGKSGVERDFCYDDPRLARLVKRLQHLPGEDLFQYRDDDGEFHILGSGDVNEYLRSVSGQDFTAKDFRTWHGTVRALQELTAAGPAASPTEEKRTVAAAIKVTAKWLGNTPATCRAYYVHPAVTEGYSSATIFRSPAAAMHHRGVAERTTLALIKRYQKRKNANTS